MRAPEGSVEVARSAAPSSGSHKARNALPSGSASAASPAATVPSGRSADAADAPAELRLLTYNVLATPIYPPLRTQAVLQILRDSNADIIALQEVAPWFLASLSEAPWVRAGYHMSRRQGRPFAPGGQLILSRRPIEKLQVAVLPGRQRRTVLVAHVRIGERTLAVATTHMESFLSDGPVRALQLTEMFSMLGGADEAVLMGDLNFGDGEQPETAHLDPKYVDLWSVLRKDAPGFTWHNQDNPLAGVGAFAGEPNRRLDRILLRSDRWRAKSIAIIGDRAAGKRRLSRRERAMIEMPERAQPNADEPMIEVFPSDHYGLSAVIQLASP